MTDTILTAYRERAAAMTAPGAPFALETVAGPHGPVRLFAGTRGTLLDLYAECLARFADADMIEADGVRTTFGRMMDDAARLGTLLHERGVVAGDRVAIAMRNRPEWFTAFTAVTRIGAVAALLNSRASGEEMRHAVELAEPRVTIADDRSAARLRDAGCDTPVIAVEDLASLLAAVAPAPPGTVLPDDPAAILYTSGTTGRAKGATLTHRNLTAAARLVGYLGRLGLELAAARMGADADAMAARMPPPSLLLSFPLFHISGVTNFMVSITTGALVTLMRRWDPEEALRLIEKNAISTVQGPSLVLADLLERPGAPARMQTLSAIAVGGQATPATLTAQVARLLPRANQGTGWGMTEVSGTVTNANGAVFKAFPDSCGIVTPLFDIRIADADGGALPAGEAGEIWVRGAPVIRGYWNDPAADAAAFHDGWLKTGDIGLLSADGLLYLVDRKKDMVVSAGENIYCAEVERVLCTDDRFLEVALFGVPDDRLGERAVVAIVTRADAGCDAAAVQASVAAVLADYKVPREVLFADEPLPRNHVGKVDKVALRRRYAERASAGAAGA